jgi:hypothetical protein
VIESRILSHFSETGAARRRSSVRIVRFLRPKFLRSSIQMFFLASVRFCHFISQTVQMCSGLSRWAVFRVHRGSETFDYELNARGQLVHPPTRQRRRLAPFDLSGDLPRSRVARWVGPQELDRLQPIQAQEELTSSSLSASEHDLGFTDECSSEVESSDGLIAGDSLYCF